MGSEKSKRSGSGSIVMYSSAVLRDCTGESCRTGHDIYDNTKSVDAGEVHVADVESVFSGNLISSKRVKKGEFCTHCSEGNHKSSMRIFHGGLDEFKPSELGSNEGIVSSSEEGESKSPRNMVGFGDLVWGKVMSHPWWPGQIYDENLAHSSLRRTKTDGSILVAFFGDCTYGWLHLDQIIPFEPHFEEKSENTKALNFTKAVEEAVDELKRRAALGLTCFCEHPGNFLPTKIEGLYKVDVEGYAPGAIYSSKQIKKSRDGFQPHGVFSFIKKLAISPRSMKNVDGIINCAKVTAYRKAVFDKNDETYDEAFDEFEKANDTCYQAFGVKASSSDGSVLLSKNGNQLQGTTGAQAITVAPNGLRVLVTPNEVILEVLRALDESKSSHALDVPIMDTEEELQNLKFPTLLFDTSVAEDEENSFEYQGSYSKESCKGETKRKRKEETPPDGLGQQSRFQKGATFDNLAAMSGEETGRIYCCESRETGKKKKNHSANDYATENGGLLSELLAFACDPLYGAELSNSTLKLLNQFRSTFYQKYRWPDKHEKTNKKRTLSECQEEHMTKKEELRGLKSMCMTKKLGHEKFSTPQEGDKIDIQATPPVQSGKKSPKEPTAKAESTKLVAKFPPQTVLPTASELKSRFAYFGPFDESATRISWESTTCEVAFMNKSNAQAAYDYTVQSRTLFNNSDVNYQLMDFVDLEECMGESFDEIRSFEDEPHHMSFQELPWHFNAEMKSLPSELPGENLMCMSNAEKQGFPKSNTINKSIVCDNQEGGASSSVKVNIGFGCENSAEVFSEMLCASSSVCSSIQYKNKAGSLDETVAAINRKYSMDEGWKSLYQRNLTAIGSAEFSDQLTDHLQKFNDIVGEFDR